MDENEKTFDDLREFLEKVTLEQLRQVPGMRWAIATLADHKRYVRCLCGIIDAMTPDERHNFTKVMNESRRRRIAAGAGVGVAEIRQCDTFAAAMKHLAERP